MVRLDVATVMLQWSAGGMLFLWVTTRRRMVSLGYGWTMRLVYLSLGLIGVVAGVALDFQPARDGLAIVFVGVVAVGLLSSVVRRRAGVVGRREEHDRRTARVAAMTGIEREALPTGGIADGPEFDPRWDLAAGIIGLIAVFAAALTAGSVVLAVPRLLAGALFLGAVSDAMMLGHWYLVQPGLERAPLFELVRWTAITWPFEVGFLLVPTGMVSVLDGTIDDAYNGLLGWFWVACAVTTIILVFVTHIALKERYYSAVMAATGFLYLAILTAFGTDLVARAVLA